MAYENDQSLYYAKQVPMQELVTYAGFTPVRRGSVFCLKEHDSFVIFPNRNNFCHYSQVEGNHYVGGSTIDFCMKYMDMDFKEALHYLCDLAGYKPPERTGRGKEYPNAGNHENRNAGRDNFRRNMLSGMQVNLKPKFDLDMRDLGEKRNTGREPMKLPEKNRDNRRVYAYLTKTRGIDPEVVKAFIDSGRLYESQMYHNCVFVTYDKEGKPMYAFQRGTAFESSYKKDVYGSDKLTGFPVFREGSAKVMVFEAPIDMMSYISLYPEDKSSMIALGCLSPKGLYRFLTQHREITTVTLLLDNDEPARRARENITKCLSEYGYRVEEHELRGLMEDFGSKDINEYLLAVRKMDRTITVPGR